MAQYPTIRTRTLLASAARTATATGLDNSNSEHRGCYVIVRVTAGASSPSVVPSIQGKDPVSGAYFQLHENIAAITSTSAATYVYLLYPGVDETEGTGGLTMILSGYLPRTWRVLMTAGNSDSLTYSVSAILLP